MNSAPYDLLSRHPDLFQPGTLVIGSEPEQPASWVALMRSGQCTYLTWDWMSHESANNHSIEHVQFTVPSPEEDTIRSASNVILLWPKARQLGIALVHVLSGQLTSFWIVGANNAGGKSIGTACQRMGLTVEKTDAAKHCSFWRVSGQPDLPTFSWHRYQKTFEHAGQSFATLPGVFCHGELDKGTALLLDQLATPKTRLGRSLLDLGCGSGVIGLTLKAAHPTLSVTLADTDALALESTRQNLGNLSIEESNDDLTRPTVVLASDRFSHIKGRFDTIISNPPFHTGKETDYRFAQTLLSSARRHLTSHGKLWIVANRHLPYEEWANEHFGHVVQVTQVNGFKILRAQL